VAKLEEQCAEMLQYEDANQDVDPDANQDADPDLENQRKMMIFPWRATQLALEAGTARLASERATTSKMR
jgi:hypothetical protein